MYATVIATIALLSTAAAFAPAGRMTRSKYVFLQHVDDDPWSLVRVSYFIQFFLSVLVFSSLCICFSFPFDSVKMALGPAAQDLVGSDIEFPEFDPLGLSAKATDAQMAQ